MTPELDKKLCETYPEIFRDRHGNMEETAMCWGLECGDGWHPLIDQLCRSLMAPIAQVRDSIEYTKKMLAEPDKSKWADWMLKSYTAEKLAEKEAELAKMIETIPVAVQVKEKFGGLCFYVHGATDEQWAKIGFAESLSYRICEVCGAMEDTRTYRMGWNQTLCPKHADEAYGDDAAHYRNKTGQWAPDDEEE